MRVAICDDTPIVRHGIVRMLEAVGVEVCAEAGDAAGLLRAVRLEAPDVAIVDIRLPPTQTDEGLVAAARIRAEHPGVGVLVLSGYVEPAYARRLVEELPERVGYLLKDRVASGEVLRDALDRIVDGECVVDPTIVRRLFARQAAGGPLGTLTPREREVLGLMAEGMSNAGISARLVLSPRTVETHVGSVFAKLGLHDGEHGSARVRAVLAYLNG